MAMWAARASGVTEYQPSRGVRGGQLEKRGPRSIWTPSSNLENN